MVAGLSGVGSAALPRGYAFGARPGMGPRRRCSLKDMLRDQPAGRAPAMSSSSQQAAESAQILVQRLLTFARRQPLSPTAVHLPDLLAGMEALLASTLGPRITLSTDLPADLPPVHADANQLELAILNLAIMMNP